MTPSLPLCSTRDAFRLLGKQLPQIESPDALLYGATAISMHQLENVDPAAVDAKLQFYADVVRGRVRGSQPQAVVAHLHELRADGPRAGRPFAVLASCLDAVKLDDYRRLEEAGVTHVQTMPWIFFGGPSDDLAQRLDGIRRFGDEIAQPLGDVR